MSHTLFSCRLASGERARVGPCRKPSPKDLAALYVELTQGLQHRNGEGYLVGDPKSLLKAANRHLKNWDQVPLQMLADLSMLKAKEGLRVEVDAAIVEVRQRLGLVQQRPDTSTDLSANPFPPGPPLQNRSVFIRVACLIVSNFWCYKTSAISNTERGLQEPLSARQSGLQWHTWPCQAQAHHWRRR